MNSSVMQVFRFLSFVTRFQLCFTSEQNSFKANFSPVPREHLSISRKPGFYLTRLHAHAGAVRCLTGIAALRQVRMKVHWWSLAGNLLLVFLALAENISFSLVSSENKILSKEKRKEINPFTNSTLGNCVLVS